MSEVFLHDFQSDYHEYFLKILTEILINSTNLFDFHDKYNNYVSSLNTTMPYYYKFNSITNDLSLLQISIEEILKSTYVTSHKDFVHIQYIHEQINDFHYLVNVSKGLFIFAIILTTIYYFYT